MRQAAPTQRRSRAAGKQPASGGCNRRRLTTVTAAAAAAEPERWLSVPLQVHRPWDAACAGTNLLRGADKNAALPLCDAAQMQQHFPELLAGGDFAIHDNLCADISAQDVALAVLEGEHLNQLLLSESGSKLIISSGGLDNVKAHLPRGVLAALLRVVAARLENALHRRVTTMSFMVYGVQPPPAGNPAAAPAGDGAAWGPPACTATGGRRTASVRASTGRCRRRR